MRLDNLEDALRVAEHLRGATVKEIADSLIDAHVEGLSQAISVLHQADIDKNIVEQLRRRRQFILSEKAKLAPKEGE